MSCCANHFQCVKSPSCMRAKCDVQDVVAEVPAAKELFDEASEILGYDLLKICVEGALTLF